MKQEKILERKKNLAKVILSSVLFFNLAYYVPQIAFAETKAIDNKVAVKGIPENPQTKPGDNPLTPETEVMLPEKVQPRVPAKSIDKDRNTNCRTSNGKLICDPKNIEEKK